MQNTNHKNTIFDEEELLTPDSFKSTNSQRPSSSYEETNKSNTQDSFHRSNSTPNLSANNLQQSRNDSNQPQNTYQNANSPYSNSLSGVNLLDLLAKKESQLPHLVYQIPNQQTQSHQQMQYQQTQKMQTKSISNQQPKLSTSPTHFSSSMSLPISNQNNNSNPNVNNSKSPKRSSTSPSKSSNSPPERFAGAAFLNSPAPSSLPLPLFGNTNTSTSNSNLNAKISVPTNQGLSQSNPQLLDPSILTFSPKKVNHRTSPNEFNFSNQPIMTQSSPKLSPRQSLTSSASSIPNTTPSTPLGKNPKNNENGYRKKSNSFHVPKHAQTESKAPSHNIQQSHPKNPSPSTTQSSHSNGPDQTYDNMSNQLKMMLNICSA